MAISKKFLKTKPICKVRFEVPKTQIENGETIYLVGDFNDWDISSTPMKKLKSGDYAITVDLETGRSYEFRYLAGENIWFNDSSADGVENTPFGDAKNSIITL